jgi:hypothetical protein
MGEGYKSRSAIEAGVVDVQYIDKVGESGGQ